MADEENRDRGPSYSHYDYSADGKPVDCPACRGTGKEMLLFVDKPCKACGGTGKRASAAPMAGSMGPASSPMARVEERVAGHWVSTSMYDGQDRLRSRVERFVPDPLASGKIPPDGGGTDDGGMRHGLA